MVALRTELAFDNPTKRSRARRAHLALVPPVVPHEALRESAYKTWIMGEEQTSRGYTLFLSESGCEVHGASRGIRMGEKVLVKIMTDANAPAMVAKAHVIERSRGRVFLAFDNLTPEAFDAFAR